MPSIQQENISSIEFYGFYIGIASIPFITYFVSKENKLRNALFVGGTLLILGGIALSQIK